MTRFSLKVVPPVLQQEIYVQTVDNLLGDSAGSLGFYGTYKSNIIR